MGVKVTNNAFGTLSAAINTTATTITLDSGQGARFPTLGASDYFFGTLVDTNNNLEIVKVTARSTDSLTVVRGQDGTTATAFAIGDRFELRPVAALFEDIITGAEVVNDTTPQLGGNLDFNGNSVSTTADFDTSSGPAITVGGGYNNGALGAAAAGTNWDDASFQRIELNDQHTNSVDLAALTADEVGPNKITFYNSPSTWVGGFGLASSTMTYFSGADHAFYKHTGSAVVEHMKLDTSGRMTVKKQPQILVKLHQSGNGYYSMTKKNGRELAVGSYGSNNALIAPIAGVYLLSLNSITTSDTGRKDINIYKNGATFLSTLNDTNTSGYHYRSCTVVVELAASDAIQVVLNQGTSYYSAGTGGDFEWSNFSMMLMA